jgi:hypothetical protein
MKRIAPVILSNRHLGPLLRGCGDAGIGLLTDELIGIAHAVVQIPGQQSLVEDLAHPIPLLPIRS